MRFDKNSVMPIFGTILFGLLMILKFSTTSVRAELLADTWGRQATPQGLSLTNSENSNSYFTYVNNFSATVPNTAKVIRGQNPKYPESDAVQLTDNINQISSIWSDVDKGNYIDTAIPQRLSMWLYFGHATTPADGIALVLQNDSRKEAAISTYNKEPLPGETLGVWGPDKDKNQTKPTVIAAGAIQNSWALEFDTFLNRNSTAGLASYFDNDFESGLVAGIIGNQHMAWNYPGIADTYLYDWMNGGSVYRMVHKDPKEFLNLTKNSDGDNSWHHLTLNYLPPVAGSTEATLIYSFNDKKTNGEAGSMLNTPNDQPYSNTIELELANFHFDKDENGVTDTKLRYGFTGSTGAQASLNMAVFETMPSLVNASSEVKAYNVSQGNREIKAGDTKSYNNNVIKFSYNVNYLSGQNDLLNTVATINLPGNMTYATTGNIGNVVYSDGKTEPIPVSEVSNGIVTHRLQRDLNNGLKGAKIEITGVTKIASGSSKTEVASAHAGIKGDLYKDDLNTPNFYIIAEPRHLSISSTSAESQTAALGSPLHFAGTMSYDDSTVIKNENMSIIVTANGQVVTTKDTASKDSLFSLDMTDESLFPVGSYPVTIQVVDQNGIASNILTYDVTVTSADPVLSTDNSELTAIQSLGTVNIPAHVTYDGSLSFDSSNLTWHMKVMNEDGTEVIKDNISAPIQDTFAGVTAQDFVQVFNLDTLGITKPGKYQIQAYVKNQHDRASNTVDYSLEVIAKSANLISDKNYSFKPINTSGESRIVDRAGDWTLEVNSIESDWTLTAKATDLTGKDADGNSIGDLNGNMVFVDSDKIMQNMNSYVLIDEQKEAITHNRDIGGNWKSNEGILLNVLPNPVGGVYTGMIDWTLNNTP
ncbi:hypothetical protein [Companilactobacillus nodensis]|uniref:hypothetical protein n=1 Tax=Companilactobacillus nodensis TaxID=460870 RepID=UPI0004687F7C|nr:hypothetical protein [Companilactobacillus nodensis]